MLQKLLISIGGYGLYRIIRDTFWPKPDQIPLKQKPRFRLVCSNCGKKLRADEEICERCGAGETESAR